jgi:hypothetical protein
MNSLSVRRLLSFALVATLFLILPAQAQRRRAVSPPTATGKLVADKINGTVVDDVTNQPVAFVHVKVGDRSDNTDALGKFEVKNVTSYHGLIQVEASRTGYATKSTQLTTGGNQTLALRVAPRPTVSVKKTNQSVTAVDFESIEFGYPVVFSGYVSASSDEFCRPSGAKSTIDRSEIRKITGPATVVTLTSCCSTHTLLKINAELKTGEITDLYFMDTCTGIPGIDLVARNHLTGKVEYTSFTDIAEIVFP